MSSCPGQHETARNIRRAEAVVVAKTPAGPDTLVITYQAPRLPARPRPGQFFMLKAVTPGFPLFGRAFSVLDYRETAGAAELDFLVKAVGSGTALLNASAVGSAAVLVGPCGNGFPQLASGTEHILVGGGTGIAPLYHLMMERSRARSAGGGLVLLHGSRDAGSLYLHDRLAALPFLVAACTEDGSIGLKGMVDLLLQRHLDGMAAPAAARIFTCGPNPMMRAVALIAAGCGIETFLSLETRMACGTGICNGCAVPVETDIGGLPSLAYLRACWDGPVFRAARLPEFRPAGRSAAAQTGGPAAAALRANPCKRV